MVPILLLALFFIGRSSIDFIKDKTKDAIEYGVNSIKTDVVKPIIDKIDKFDNQNELINDELSNAICHSSC